MPLKQPDEDELVAARRRANEDAEVEDADRQFQARAHFPHLAGWVVPRESDEYPTFWED